MQTATLLLPDIRLTPEPVATPEKFRSGHCHLELTPVWQYVVKKNRFPSHVDRQEVFSELAVRLQHPEWQVRLHGSRVLAYIVPTVGSQLDALMSPTVLPMVITNLAHFSPALRSSSMDALLVYVQHSSDPEFVLKSMIVQGLDVPGAKSSLTVNVMECVPVVLQQIVKRHGDRPIAIPTFVHLVTALSNKMVQATFQQAAVYCLDRVKDIVGRNKFDHYLETFHPVIKKDFEVLCEVYRISSSSGQDSSVSSYEEEDDDEVEMPKTPRRVTFGGERIKIRSPDEIEMIKPTGIPVPLRPALSMPKHPRGEDKTQSKPTQPHIPPSIRTTRNVRHFSNFLNHDRQVDQVRPYTLPPLRQSNFKQFSSSHIGPLLGSPSKGNLNDRILFYKGYFSPHAILSVGRTCDSFDKNYEKLNDLKMDKAHSNLESPAKLTRPTFCMTVVPESRIEKPSVEFAVASNENQNKTHNQTTLIADDLSTAESVYRQHVVDPEDRPIGFLNETKSLSHSTIADVIPKPASNIQLYTTSVNIRPQNCNDKPVAEVKPTKTVKTLADRRKSAVKLPKKIDRRPSSEPGPNFTPFNDPHKALQLICPQINSTEWEAVVTGLQNISRLAIFHCKELRPSAFQPYGRIIAKHIRCLRSQVARAACTATENIFTYVPKSVEPDIEEIASALFPRTADTNKFLRTQSSDALNAMVDNVNPCKCVLVITTRGVKHGNRLVRAEACRLLAKIVDKIGVNGTLHLPTEVRDAVITAATSLVIDNTPTSRQAAQRILAKLSEDPRGAALISSAASPNVKATLNKSLSRIFLK